MKKKNVSTSKRSEKTLSVIKNVKVKLTPLSPDTIRRYLESSADRNCSSTNSGSKNKTVLKVRESGIKIPMTITVKSIISKPTVSPITYNLRKNKKPEEEEKRLLKSVRLLLSLVPQYEKTSYGHSQKRLEKIRH